MQCVPQCQNGQCREHSSDEAIIVQSVDRRVECEPGDWYPNLPSGHHRNLPQSCLAGKSDDYLLWKVYFIPPAGSGQATYDWKFTIYRLVMLLWGVGKIGVLK